MSAPRAAVFPRVRRLLALGCLTLALGLVAPIARGTCTLNVQAATLGAYDYQNTQPLTGVGHVMVSCDAPSSYTISLGPGTGNYLTRALSNGAHQLAYNLYIDATYTTVWGDGSNGTGVVSGAGIGDDHVVYASVPAGQNPTVGTYTDAITVTVVF